MLLRILAGMTVVATVGCGSDRHPQAGAPITPPSPTATPTSTACGEGRLLLDLEQYRLPYSLRALASGHDQTMAVWKENDIVLAGQRPYAIRAMTFTPTGGWRQGESIGGFELPLTGGPFSVSSAANGELAALWTAWDGRTYTVLGSLLPPGAPWRTPEVLYATTIGVGSLDIGHDEHGGVVAVWAERTEPRGRGDLWTSTFEAGVWQAPQGLGRVFDLAERPRLTLGKGGGLLVWVDLGYDRRPQNEIWARRYSPSGWSRPERIQAGGSPEVYSFGDLAAARAPNGDAVVVWPGQAGDAIDIRAAHFLDGRWTDETVIGPGFLFTSITPRSVAGYAGPRVGIDATGNGLAIWSGRPPSPPWRGIWASRLTAGAGWTAMERIDAGNNANATYPALAVHASGVAVAAWLESTEPDSIPRTGTGYNPHSVWLNRYLPGRGWERPLMLFGSGGDALTVAAAVDSSGQASIVWAERPEVTRSQIWSCSVAMR